MPVPKPCVLTIAGSDSSGGAGIQADIKTISALGCYAASIITALTAQNTLGVQAVEAVSPVFVQQQFTSVCSDLKITAVKIGMLYNKNCMMEVASALASYKPKNIIIDPVMIAKNGHALMDISALTFLKRELFPFATLITPNLPEAERLLNRNINTHLEQELAAKELAKQCQVNVLIKGGHLRGDQASDVLCLYAKMTTHWAHAQRIDSKHTHGTGCSLSAAIATYLAKGYVLEQAVRAAKDYLTRAIRAGLNFNLGQGCGPVDHFCDQSEAEPVL